MVTDTRCTRIGIFYPSDPLGNVPSGIDSFIKGILKFAPPDLEYTLLGASADVNARTPGVSLELAGESRPAHFLPLTGMDADGRRRRLPLTIRYLWALRRALQRGLCRDFDILDVHRIEPLVLLGRDRRPKNLTLHQDMSIVRDKNADVMWKHAPGVYESLERRLLRTADRIFCVRQSGVDRYRAANPDIGERISFIPTWVDTDVFRPAADEAEAAAVRREHLGRLGLALDATLLVFVGRLDRQKDPMLLLDAFALASASDPSRHLALIGDGVLRGEVERGIAARGLQGKVSLLGAMGARQIAGWLKAADLFVLASAYEGMPIAVLEALACGLPVVSTDVGEIRRVVRNGSTGEIASPREAAALHASITCALAATDTTGRAARCVDAIQPYRPEVVLSMIYDNHRRQAGRAGS